VSLFAKKMVHAAAQMRIAQTAFVSSTTRREQTTVIGPDKQAGSNPVEQSRFYRQTRWIILSVMQARSRLCWPTPSIDFVEDSSTRA
jgi:hypothetical protein